jgi:hypothetical protein
MFPLKLTGVEAVKLAKSGQHGTWINVFNKLCALKQEPDMVERAVQHLPPDPHPLHLAIGPSPWAFVNRSTTVGGVGYKFRNTVEGDSKLSGLTSLQDAEGNTLLILDFHFYARIHDDGTMLLWRETGDKESARIAFDLFPLSSLSRIADPLATAKQLRENSAGMAPLPASVHWEFASHLEAGVYPISLRHDWSRFGETLVLASHATPADSTKAARAIFVFDWCKQQVEVLPQDWFNKGEYDFGYQWISRVARQTDGSATLNSIARTGKSRGGWIKTRLA